MDFYVYSVCVLQGILPYMESSFHLTGCQTTHILRIFPLCHVINCAVGWVSLLQISLEPTGTVASINICFKILLFPFHCEFSYSSVGLLFQSNNLRKENGQLLIKQMVKKDQELLYLNFVGNRKFIQT